MRKKAMEHPDYNSPSDLKTFLEDNAMSMQKKFGQNFLVNGDARKKIVNALALSPGMNVWEVGPGLGAMTEEILSRGAKLTVFEIDRGFVKMLKNFYEKEIASGELTIIEGDVLKTWKRQCDETGIPERFFGNLPYNIASAIIGDTIEQNVRFDKAVVTVQKEVAQRMTSAPGTGDYSSFSILCQWAYDVETVMDLAGGNFWPRPNVDSRAVVMTKRGAFPGCESRQTFMKMQRALFVSRRKNIKNNLTQFLSDAEKADTVLRKAGIDPSLRAEAVTVEQLLQLSDIINADIMKS
jgi:16S rRNA (adenine1518-N6/adenine1519-N6)-dimethyltransferase